jgi:hypothetical protein
MNSLNTKSEIPRFETPPFPTLICLFFNSVSYMLTLASSEIIR